MILRHTPAAHATAHNDRGDPATPTSPATPGRAGERGQTSGQTAASASIRDTWRRAVRPRFPSAAPDGRIMPPQRVTMHYDGSQELSASFRHGSQEYHSNRLGQLRRAVRVPTGSRDTDPGRRDSRRTARLGTGDRAGDGLVRQGADCRRAAIQRGRVRTSFRRADGRSARQTRRLSAAWRNVEQEPFRDAVRIEGARQTQPRAAVGAGI
jgi:hypothetical protein